MRVVMDITPLVGQPTGVGEFVRSSVAALRASHHNIDIEGFSLTARGFSLTDAHGPLHSACPPSAQRILAPASLMIPLWGRVSFPSIDWFLRGPSLKHTDVVHGTNGVVPPTLRARRIVTVHDVTALRYPELVTSSTRRSLRALRRAIDTGAHVHTVSRATATDIGRYLSVPTHRMHVVYPGVAPAAPATRVDHRFANTPYVLAMGTVEPRKNYPTLVRAFDQLARTHPDVQLVIAGAPGWGSDALNKALGHAAHQSRIHLLGYVTDELRHALVRDALVLAYPSLLEGFGYPPLEAMGAGVPVVASDVPAVKETCGDAALLVPSLNVEALTAALDEVVVNASTRAALIAKGKERALSFTWERCARSLAAMYESVAS